MTTVNDNPPVASPTRPRLRGWLHVGAFPAVLVAGLVLVALGPSVQARLVRKRSGTTGWPGTYRPAAHTRA